MADTDATRNDTAPESETPRRPGVLRATVAVPTEPLASAGLAEHLRQPEVRQRVARRVFQRVSRALYLRRYAVLGVLALALVLGGVGIWRAFSDRIAAVGGVFPVEVSVQALEPQGNALVLTLKEKNGNRRLGLPIEETEARVISRERGMRIQGEQPREYDLMRDIVQQLDGRVDRIIVSEMSRTQNSANVVLSFNNAPGTEPRVVKASSGDAVALAIKAGAPIYVEEHILVESGTKEGK